MCRICWSVRHLSTHLQTNYLKYNLVNSSNWRPQESPTPPLWVGQMFNSLLLLFKNRTILGLFFVSFRSFTSKQHKFSNKIMYKISIQYLVPRFELTTFCFEPPPLTTRTGHPSFTHWSLVPPFGMVWNNVSILGWSDWLPITTYFVQMCVTLLSVLSREFCCYYVISKTILVQISSNSFA